MGPQDITQSTILPVHALACASEQLSREFLACSMCPVCFEHNSFQLVCKKILYRYRSYDSDLFALWKDLTNSATFRQRVSAQSVGRLSLESSVQNLGSGFHCNLW